MLDNEKVNGAQLHRFWKNLIVGLLIITASLLLSRILPYYFSLILSLTSAGYLYSMFHINKLRNNSCCMIVPYSLFFCMLSFAGITIVVSIIDILQIADIPNEFSFFNYPFIAALILDPVCFFTMIVIYLRRNRLALCIDCKLSRGLGLERGRLGEILESESRVQIKNLILIFGLMTIIVWSYYLRAYYRHSIVNDRDWYVFCWLNVIVFLLDSTYFALRYYNLYLDLKENDELITESDISDTSAKTYLRIYLVHNDKIFLSRKLVNSNSQQTIIDTPFVSKNDISIYTHEEVYQLIKRRFCGKDGILKFFFGRKSLDIIGKSTLRYFYFVDSTDISCEYTEMMTEGEWIEFTKLKKIYNNQPQKLSKILLTDISRLVTIIITQKIYDERGYRKLNLKSYQPNCTLEEVRDGDYDFQDDKWIRVAINNSDQKWFKLMKFYKKYLSFNQHTKQCK